MILNARNAQHAQSGTDRGSGERRLLQLSSCRVFECYTMSSMRERQGAAEPMMTARENERLALQGVVASVALRAELSGRRMQNLNSTRPMNNIECAATWVCTAWPSTGRTWSDSACLGAA